MIYFDNAATTPLTAAARAILTQDFYNPSAPHALGITAKRAFSGALKGLAEILSCRDDELLITSGGTESNNLGILGAAFALKARHNKRKLRILASLAEHPSVVEPLKFLASLPDFTVEFAHQKDWEFCPDTRLVCLTQVASETGDIFVFKKPQGVVLFVDGAQGFAKMPFDGQADIYSFSGHKIGGLVGVGGLMIRKGIVVKPLMYGGGQQRKLRPGTENVAGATALLAAARECLAADLAIIAEIRRILAALSEELPGVCVNQLSDSVSPYILNMSFLGIKGEVLVNALSQRGVCVSTGAACRALKKGSALENMGFDRVRADSAVRFSFFHLNSVEEAERVGGVVKECVEGLRV
ncbi:MAG: aminotransferase class V-fold PLP-dependent enzyme [Turicibacter sp.]|nr:aminotransferase class V-fold PLP-dependent enzyme [Turicibacter sp.]